MPGFLEVRGLRKAYGSTVAVDGLELSIERGECFGLLGPNGAGKSTTIAMIAGTLAPDAGEVLLAGARVGPRSFAAKQRIGYVPQDLALYEELSARENLRFFGTLYGLHGSGLVEQIDLALALAGLSDRAGSIVGTFSGGMKRRLNIAAALMHDPDFVILDEPTVGVDPQSRNLIFEALSELLAQGKTILYTTHYMEEVERLCSRVAIMDGGRVIASGSLAELQGFVASDQLVLLRFRSLPASLDGQLLAGVSGVISHKTDGASMTLELEELSRDLPPLLTAISHQGIEIEEVKTIRPSLEEVFLKLTGRSLRDD